MRLIRQPEAGHYHVRSERDAEVLYDVEILAYNGAGHCTCDDWLYRIGPTMERGEIPSRRFCKHIIEAREDFTDLIIERMLASMTRPG